MTCSVKDIDMSGTFCFADQAPILILSFTISMLIAGWLRCPLGTIVGISLSIIKSLGGGNRMPRPIYEDTMNEPDFEECLSRGIADDLSRCLAHNVQCAHAVPAGDHGAFCQHPENRMDLPYGFLSKPPAGEA